MQALVYIDTVYTYVYIHACKWATDKLRLIKAAYVAGLIYWRARSKKLRLLRFC